MTTPRGSGALRVLIAEDRVEDSELAIRELKRGEIPCDARLPCYNSCATCSTVGPLDPKKPRKNR